MNSALKPVLPQPGVPQPGGQASPAKGNVATANHTVGHPQGAQNSLHHASNNLVGQNLTHHAPVPPIPHAPPPMAPVSANMAQMAQNMSHHGNLSHVTQNSVVGPSNLAASPSKGGNPNTPLSLVQEKALALTRTPEKNEADSTAHANGTIDSPKSATNAPVTLKPQNPEPNKEKQDIAKTSPSTPKPPEKPTSAPSTPQKTEAATPATTADGPAQPKVAAANEPPEKSPSKPTELKPAPAADVAPTQSDSKPVPESANDSQLQEKAPTPVKQDLPPTESAKTESVPAPAPAPELKPDEKPEEAKAEQKPQQNATEEKKEEVVAPKPEKSESPKKEEAVEKPAEKVEEKGDDKKAEAKPAKVESKPKSTMKLATVTPPMRKRRQVSPSKTSEGPSPAKKPAEGDSTPDTRIKRNRTKVQLYQSPTPELAMATKLSASAGRSTPTKPNDDKLIVFYKNEYLAVRNAEGGFYVCQAMQNVYRTTRKIKIRWLSQDKTADPSGETYKPDFYDVTDMECVLTTLSLVRGAGGAQLLRGPEAARARSILTRALHAEAHGHAAPLTEEHPDGLDLSLYKDESQLEKKSRKRNSSKSSPRAKQDNSNNTEESATPVKRARTMPKRSPKSARKTKAQTKTQTNNKRKSSGSTPIVASTSKVGIVQRIYRNTATAVSDKVKAKSTPKRTPAKQKVDTPLPTPTRKGRRAELKASPIVPTPSTSTGKTTRTPRKPPAKK
ncbi:neurofilament heavy polypeptide-like isoform X1 [Trichoplusia ni]|uniref:Neurofilament heavy polypeptide-like isoform X1 n=1 Tax=Trichoplusia ni TaxID=7111 RepID=A0A7E5WU28_TRINI|nr:neurofilament heavy polypeptide-like isoform X1 [Trichoplusia ni]